MSKSASVAFKAHLAGDQTTLACIWKVTRTDGEVFGFTDHDQTLEIGGIDYVAAVSGSVSAFVTGSDLAVDNAEVAGFFDSAAITEADLLTGKWDFAEVRASLVNWADVSMGALKTRRGWLGEVGIDSDQFVVELRGLMQKLQQQVGRIYSALCDADFGDDRCGLDVTATPNAQFTSTVTAVTSNRVFASAGLVNGAGSPSVALADNWFAGGKAEWLDGDNVGLTMEIKSSAAGVITLQLPMPHDIAASDSIRVTAGCLKRRTEDCFGKWGNVINNRSFPDVPGPDRVRSGQ